MNKALETKIRALIAKERIVTTKALHAEWHAVDWVIFYACAPFAQTAVFSDFLLNANLRRSFYPQLFTKLVADPKELKSEAQGVHDFTADAEKTLDNIPMYLAMTTQVELWLEAYSMLLDTLSLFKSRHLGSPLFTEAFSHIDPSVRSNELGNDDVTTDVNVLGKIFLQTDSDRMATLLNTSFRGSNSRIRAFYSVGVPTDEAGEIMHLTPGIIHSYADVLEAMNKHIQFLSTLPHKRPASPAKQSDTANHRNKGDGKAGLNTKRHGKVADGESAQKPHRRANQNAQGHSAKKTQS